ncbi:Na+/H+ antiporter [Kaistia sp. 32K]|uniref:Na+/H+ antiporter n=1 Tax=Kaistia sp. 32K TaxID=2795690 RepID=UPI001915827F|nr:Na+/H+ antiporter [Kaistia sp. 32K]BCP54725.1 Na+/H+ antiporter [Kaistia sp. 32K]
METISIVLVLLLAVVVSGFIARMLPLGIPRPLLQIALGGAIGLIADFRVTLNPDIFFLLFLPPLLFLDGWRTPKEELIRDRRAILALALGLVVFTVLGVGLFINYLIPAMPLAVAFALAAVISPTDPIAVSAIAARVRIPKRMMHILEGEALLNDASGLVCLRFAVAAALTGTFSLSEAMLDFVWVAFGGVLIGYVVTWIINTGKSWIADHYGEETGSQILISVLTPFAAYLSAEHLQCSGILAAVAAGVTMSFSEASGHALATTRVRRNNVWDMIQFAANGIIFVILGEQLPAILHSAAETVRVTGHHAPGWLLIYVLAINLSLAILRFVWVWVSLNFSLYRARRRGETVRRPSWRLLAAMSLAGVRGAITLAGVLTLPLFLYDGTPFPARDLAIFLAMGVIILSLIAASIGLPLLLRGLDLPEASPLLAEQKARIAAAEAAIAEIERVQHELAGGRPDADIFVAAAARLMDAYRARIDAGSRADEEAALARQIDAIETRMRIAALQAERTTVFKLLRGRKIGSETARKLVRELDLMEARYEG